MCRSKLLVHAVYGIVWRSGPNTAKNHSLNGIMTSQPREKARDSKKGIPPRLGQISIIQSSYTHTLYYTTLISSKRLSFE